MKKNSAAMRFLTGAALFLSGAILSACDQPDERIRRVGEITDAAMRQISGEPPAPAETGRLERASLLDRALAGTVTAGFDAGEEQPPLFVIGSIIAKPADIIAPDPAGLLRDEALIAEELNYFADGEEDGPGERGDPLPGAVEGTQSLPAAASLPKIRLDPRAADGSRAEIERAGRAIEKVTIDVRPVRPDLPVRDLASLEPGQRSEIRKLARRAPVTRSAVQKQLDANTIMLDTMTRYRLGGEVALSRQGQMVIQLGPSGASPTQFRGPSGPSDFLARAELAACPDNPDPELIRADLALATACVVRDLRASGQFEYVEPDFIFHNQFARRPPAPGGAVPDASPVPGAPGAGLEGPGYEPDDPLWTLQWNLRDRGSTGGRSAGGAGFESFWNRQGLTGSGSVVVAVVDTGLQMGHPDISGSANIMPGWDMVSDPRMGNDGDGRDPDPDDPGDLCDPTRPGAADSFHGTHVAGTIGAAATDNAAGVAGAAWNVKIVPVRALGKCGGRLSDINDGIRWAAGLIPAEGDDGSEVWNEHPADIINLSIGLLGSCPASLQDAIDSAVDAGVIIVSAAGNARMATRYYAPAGCTNVITVAASDARGQIAPYSNFGPEVAILAPGGDLTRDDNGDGKPDGILSTKSASNCYDPVTGQGVEACFYAYEQGTSMAAPHVSAALALLKARDPSAGRENLLATLRSALDPTEALQCAGPCNQYPGASPIEGSNGMCARPCGEGLLNLARLPRLETAGGAR